MEKYTIVSGPEKDQLIEAFQKGTKNDLYYFEFLVEVTGEPIAAKAKDLKLKTLTQKSKFLTVTGECKTSFSDSTRAFTANYDSARHFGFLTLD